MRRSLQGLAALPDVIGQQDAEYGAGQHMGRFVAGKAQHHRRPQRPSMTRMASLRPLSLLVAGRAGTARLPVARQVPSIEKLLC